MPINRDFYLNKLIRSKGNKRIKVITGIRRSGKSFLLSNLYYNYLIKQGVEEKQIIQLKLDDIDYMKYRNPIHLNEYIKEKLVKDKMNYVFIDEIQFVEKIENPYLKNNFIGFYDVLNGLLGIENVDVYVTGSNSKMLSSDVLTEFRGRGDQIHIFPLSFKELYDYKNVSFKELYNQYQTYGGLPYVSLLENNEQKSNYLINLFNETYLIDVIEKNNIINTGELSTLILMLASSIGSLTNPTKIQNTFNSELKITYNYKTITKHINYLIEAFILKEAKRYDIKGRKYIGANSKYYFSDIGLRNALLNYRQQEHAHIMENIIYNQLLMLGFNVDVGIVEVYEKQENKYIKKQLEVNFIINKGNLKYYIQSAYHMETKEKQVQEKRSLLNINDSFKKIIIINDNFKAHYDNNGFLLISLEEFLLDYDILTKY